MKTLLTTLYTIALLCGAAAANEFPTRTIEVLTHAGPGGGTDVTARMMMLRARLELKTDMVVVNKRGWGGGVAMDHFLDQVADGHTILVFTSGHAASMAHGRSKLTLEDIRPIARGTDDPQILMVRCGSYADAGAFVDAQRQYGLTYGTTHLGNIDDVSAHMFTKKGGLAAPEVQPYSGGGQLAEQLVAGSVDVAVLNLAEAGAEIATGAICPIVVLADRRLAALPEVTTAKELGIDVSFSTVRGFVVHRETPDAVAKQIEAALLNAMNHVVYQAFLTSVGLDASSVAGAEEWGAQIGTITAEMDAALRELGFTE
ncbi:Bug family tripartite tricarboxylate transporter substrate binding protein [Thalassobius sp. MITS945101]|uniref:Bug family tripartite tricarboxylate transporter substrate binding protein n=1 Tax=Thalassobius sp. MITS945101 TaxID=3096994 RepID=UPI00399BBF3C